MHSAGQKETKHSFCRNASDTRSSTSLASSLAELLGIVGGQGLLASLGLQGVKNSVSSNLRTTSRKGRPS